MRNLEIKNIPIYLSVDGQRVIQLATGYTRLLEGGRGTYLEIPAESMLMDVLEAEPGQEYRLGEKWQKLAYYAWLRVKSWNVKVYLQYKQVTYADYLPGYFYISASFVVADFPFYRESHFCPVK